MIVQCTRQPCTKQLFPALSVHSAKSEKEKASLGEGSQGPTDIYRLVIFLPFLSHGTHLSISTIFQYTKNIFFANLRK